jgi:hypothetical protein
MSIKDVVKEVHTRSESDQQIHEEEDQRREHVVSPNGERESILSLLFKGGRKLINTLHQAIDLLAIGTVIMIAVGTLDIMVDSNQLLPAVSGRSMEEFEDAALQINQINTNGGLFAC